MGGYSRTLTQPWIMLGTLGVVSVVDLGRIRRGEQYKVSGSSSERLPNRRSRSIKGKRLATTESCRETGAEGVHVSLARFVGNADNV